MQCFKSLTCWLIMVTMTFQNHKALQETLWGGGGSQKDWHEACPKEKRSLKGFMQSLQLIIWPGLRSERRQEASGQGKKYKESVWRTRAWLHLAGVPTQLLPARRLILLRFRAGVGAPVEGRHSAAFAVCVKAAVRRVVCLAVPFGLLECTDCERTHTRAQLQTE